MKQKLVSNETQTSRLERNDFPYSFGLKLPSSLTTNFRLSSNRGTAVRHVKEFQNVYKKESILKMGKTANHGTIRYQL